MSRQRLDTLLGEVKAREAKMGTCLSVQWGGSSKPVTQTNSTNVTNEGPDGLLLLAGF